MKLTVKGFIALMAALLLAVLGGWMWGAVDHARTDDALMQAGAGLHVAAARARMLEARVDLFEVNFGNASRHLEAARADLKAAAQSFDRLGRTSDAEAMRNALARVAQHGTPAAQRKVKAAVHKRFPSIGKKKSKKS